MRDTENCRYPDCLVHQPARLTIDEQAAAMVRMWAQIVADWESGDYGIDQLADDFALTRGEVVWILLRGSAQYRPQHVRRPRGSSQSAATDRAMGDGNVE